VRSIRHPLSGATYDLLNDGSIHVTGRDDLQGVFDKHGRWQSGDLRHADPHLCLWIGGTELPNRFQLAADAINATEPASSEETES